MESIRGQVRHAAEPFGTEGRVTYVGLSEELKTDLKQRLVDMKDGANVTITYSETFDLMLDVQEVINLGSGETRQVTIF